MENFPNSQPTHSIEPELRQPLPRIVRMDPSFALRQMTRVVVLTVASSLLWVAMGQLTAPVSTLNIQPHPVAANPNALEVALQTYRGVIAMLIAGVIGCLVFFCLSVFFESARRYQLALNGAVGIGRIISKKIALGRDGSFIQINYRFAAPGGALVLGRTDCSLAEWQEAKSDTQMTVLFDPKNPSNSTLYPLGGFKAA